MSTRTLDRTAAWRTEASESVTALAWSRSRHVAAPLLAVADLAGNLTLVDGGTGRVCDGAATAHPGGAYALAWQPGGDVLATGGADGRVRLHDQRSRDVRHVETGAVVHALSWSRTGSLLAVAAGRSLLVLDPAGRVLRCWPGQPSTVPDLVWSRDGSRVAAAAYGGLRWYSVTSTRPDPVRVFDWRGSLLLARSSPDGRWVASGHDAGVHVWRLWSGEDAEMSGYPEKVDALAFDRTGRWMANGGTTAISVWDFSGRGPTGRSPRMLPGHDGQVSALAWQPTGDVLASAGRDGGLALWQPGPRARHAEPLLRVELPGRVTTLAWHPDGSVVVAGTVTGGVVAVCR